MPAEIVLTAVERHQGYSVSMRYRISTSVAVIGSSDLEFEDPSMGTAFGAFTPEKAYEDVRHIFKLFADAQPERADQPVDEGRVSEYYRLRDQLGLRIVNAAGEAFVPEIVHIEDYFDLQNCLVTVHFRTGEDYDEAMSSNLTATETSSHGGHK